MRLNVAERLNLLTICINYQKKFSPDLTSNKVITGFIADLGFDQEELDKLQFSKNGTDWNKSEDKFKEIKIGNKVKEIIQDKLKKLDQEGKLNFLKHFGLCEKFSYEPQEESKVDKKVEKR